MALSPKRRQSARMSEIKNGRLGLYGAVHSKCNHVMILGVKGLKSLIFLPVARTRITIISNSKAVDGYPPPAVTLTFDL